MNLIHAIAQRSAPYFDVTINITGCLGLSRTIFTLIGLLLMAVPQVDTNLPIEYSRLPVLSEGELRLSNRESFLFRTAEAEMRQKSILSGFLFYLLATAVILSSVNSPASAQLIKLNVGYSAISGEQLPAWIAKETRIFEKDGLDVQLIYFTGGSLAVLALVSGEVPISQVAGPAVVNSALAGSDVIMVAAGATSLDYWLMSLPEIKKPDQLKGGSVAISRFGTASDFVARYALNKIGLVPGKDVAIVQVGGVPDRLGAVLAGKVQGAILNPPASFVGQKKGLNILADVSKLGLAFQYTGVATSRRFTREHPDIVRRYVRSQIEAVNLIHTDKETSLKVLTKYFGGNVERDILEKSWELLADENMLPKKQYPSLEGIKFILAPLSEKDAKARAAKPEDFADLSFIKEFDQSGYIDSLYKKK
jgi:NitT/TauT family transport system substrate-binding protein